MTVANFTPFEAVYVEFEGDETTYLRLGADSWLYRAGESLEAEYRCTEHEAEYQAALRLAVPPPATDKGTD